MVLSLLVRIGKLADMKRDVIFPPIRHPQANPGERCMREIGKFCRVYCHEAHKRWPEFLSHIQGWFIGTLSDSTGYSPVEPIFDSPRSGLFEEFLQKGSEQKHGREPTGKRSKSRLQDEEKVAKRNKRGRQEFRSGNRKEAILFWTSAK
jgi:hypothetical protein